MRGRGAAVVMLAAVVTLAGCVGSITRQDLDEEMRSRGGGGIGQQLAVGAVEALQNELGTDDVQLRSLTLSPGRAALEVRVDGPTDELDAYQYGTSGLYGGRGLDGPTPLEVHTDGLPLDAQVFSASDAGLDRLGDMIDGALQWAALPDGYVERATVTRPNDAADPVIAVIVTNRRNTTTVAFAPDGTVLEVTAQ